MQEVAERAGVSRTTVSFVLNDTPNVNIPNETRARIWKAASDLNYAHNFAAHSLATGRSHTVAFILRQKPSDLLVNAFLGGILNGITEAFRAEDYHLLFDVIGDDISDGIYTDLIRSQRVDGLLVSGPIINDRELKQLHNDGVPVVIQGTPDDDTLYCVDIDNITSARHAVQHLLDLGHRHIAHITNASLSYTASRDRLTGYCQALQAAGLACDEALITTGAFTDASGYEAMNRLLESHKPTAVFVGSDVVALGALKAIQEHGLRIPEDISLIGFDDIPLSSYVAPGLTTVRIPLTDLGMQAGQMLVQLLDGETPPRRQLQLDARLIVRGSTAPPAS